MDGYEETVRAVATDEKHGDVSIVGKIVYLCIRRWG